MTPPLIRKSVAELAAFLGGQAEGDLACLIEGVAALDAAGPSDLSFLENPKYAEAAKASKAGCLLLPPQAKGQVFAAKARIYIEDAREAFSRILILIEAGRPKLAPVLSPKASIHYEARLGPGVSVGDFTVIERGAAVAEGTSIGPQCFIGENARVGRACRLSPGVVIRENCVVGDRAVLHAGAVIGADGFGFTTDRKTGRHGKMPQIGNVVLENDVEVGANTTIDRATIGSTVIGAGTKIDNLVQIGHNVRTGRDCLLVSQVGISGSTILGDRVILAGQAGLAGHLRVGDGAIVMAQSGIMGDVEAGAAVFGSPARPRREAFKLLALTAKLSEIYESIKEIKEKLGLKPRDRAAAQD